MAFDPDAYLATKDFDPDAYLADMVPSEQGQVVTPEDVQPDEHDLLYFKTGKTRTQRESDNALFRQAMQTPAVSPETATRGFSALGEIGPLNRRIWNRIQSVRESVRNWVGRRAE